MVERISIFIPSVYGILVCAVHKTEGSHRTAFVDPKLANNGSIDPCGASQGKKEHGTGKNGRSEQPIRPGLLINGLHGYSHKALETSNVMFFNHNPRKFLYAYLSSRSLRP